MSGKMKGAAMEERKGLFHWSGRIDPALVGVVIAAVLVYGGERSANAETRRIVESHAEMIQKIGESLNATNERTARIEAQTSFLVREAQK